MFKKILIWLLLLTAIANATAPTEENVTELYIATFNRAPDACGLHYWIYSSGLSLEEIATSFFEQGETQAKYPATLTDAEFINTVYNNLFNRNVDPDGLDYWLDELQSGSMSRSQFILAVVNGAIGVDAAILANKTEVGLYFVRRKGQCGVKLEDAISVMSNVTEDPATVVVAKIQIDDLGAPACVVKVGDLIWQNDYDGRYIRKTWSEAKNYCSVLTLDGKTDWRLPTIDELNSIVDTRYHPTILLDFCGNCVNALYWSSTETRSKSNRRVLLFFNGQSYFLSIYDKATVRCVRDK